MSQTHPSARSLWGLALRKRFVLKTISAVAIALSLTVVNTHAITRSCDAKLLITKSGKEGFPESFSAKGNCGSNVPNRCRERAKEAAIKCAAIHWDKRWDRKKPEHCEPGANVHDYGINDLKQWIENRSCEKGWNKGTVNLVLKTYGGDRHCDMYRVIHKYDMLPDFCK